MEVLPEEFSTEMQTELCTYKSNLESFINDDLKFLEQLIRKKIASIQLNKFQKDSVIIRKGFPLRSENLNSESEKIQFYLSHLMICKIVLLYLASEIINNIPIVKANFDNYNIEKLGKQKRISFIFLTRTYQESIGYAVNMIDIIDEYTTVFEILHKLLDSKHEIGFSSTSSYIYEHELLSGASELLLRGNTGRFTSSPLIRSALEVIIIRNILNTEQSTKYKNKNMLLLKNFSFKDMLNSVQELGYDISIGIDAMRRLYEWGSVIVHKAQTYTCVNMVCSFCNKFG